MITANDQNTYDKLSKAFAPKTNVMSIMCECCRKKEATIKDYRFIDRVQLHGKVKVCKECFNLTDVDFVFEYCKPL